ncbi:MAG: sigma-70 family RNA polymerase sigma factor [Bacteroidales bacterium]|jgi:RNA polymerase sigma-70 factor (ECF subfamily)|nr:sigma-70 family RNA polymerase sigma factor [Bacteroidales bacterium]MBR4199321.1 sigma-70 family RNA polymerase sigma factor [Bacteroidales bacterium]
MNVATKAMISDNELINGYRNGNYADFETLLARHQAKVYGYIFSVVKDKNVADDIFQDTFLKVVQTINSGMYKDENKFIHWVMRISHNLIVDHFRRVSKLPTVNKNDFLLENLRVLDDNVEKVVIKNQTRQDIRKLIKKLPDEQRRVVILRHYGKYEFKDIAEKTGVSINTALGRMRYAIINLRRLARNSNVMLEI